MLKNIIVTGAVILFAGIFSLAAAQSPPTAVKPSLVPGEVTSINDKKIVINATNGPVEAELSSKTEFKRVSPDKPSLTNAAAAALTDIEVGDKVVISGFPATDGKT